MSELLGEYSRKLDAKGRLSLPADFRKVLSEDLKLTLSPDNQCLCVYETTAFKAWVDSLFEAQGGFNPANRKMAAQRKILHSRATKLDLDNAGRINLSQAMRETAGLNKDVVIVGDVDHFEIWDEERWNQFVADTDITSLFTN